MPGPSYIPEVEDIIKNFLLNWKTLTPALSVLFGTLAAFFFLTIIKNKMAD